MNYIIANSVCCCLQCCCKQLFQTMYKIVGKTSFIKIMYFIIYASFISILLTAFIFLRDWPFFMDYIAQGINCSNANDFDCITVSLIYRMVTSISIFIIFILLIMSLCTVRISHILNEGLFFSKFVAISVIFFLLLQFGNQMYQHLSVAYEYISYLFLICQGIIIIDLGYLWGIRWAEKFSTQSARKYGFLLITCTLIMFGVSIFFNIYGYVLVSHETDHMQSIGLISECSNLPNILNTVFIVLCIGIQLINFNKQNSLLTTSFMCIYISFWCFSAIYSSNKCNLNYDEIFIQDENDKHYSKADFYFVGSIFSVFWLLLSTFGSIFGSTNKIQDYQNGQQIEFIELEENIKSNTRNMLEGRQEIFPDNYYTGENKKNWLIWHFFMLTMVIYLSMILTDWGSGNLITKKYSLNTNVYASKLFMASFSFTVYIWTLLAPRLFPNRNFYFR